MIMTYFDQFFSRLESIRANCLDITGPIGLPRTGFVLAMFSVVAFFPTPAQAKCAPQGASETVLPDYACFSAAQASRVYSNPTNYQILRKGKKIGKHRISFETSGATADSTRVEVASSIRVTVLKVPVFTFEYRSSESWDNGVLMKVEASTTENSTTTRVSATRDANGFVLQRGSATQAVSGMEFSSNHWHPGVLGATSLFNTLTGKQNNVRVEKLGSAQLSLPAGNFNATHFRYTGSLDAEVWYDDTGRWVQLRFENDDGSEILYLLDK